MQQIILSKRINNKVFQLLNEVFRLEQFNNRKIYFGKEKYFNNKSLLLI